MNPIHIIECKCNNQSTRTQQYHHSHGTAGPYTHANAEHVAYYSPSLPTPAVSPASSCSGPNLPPPGQQYAQQQPGHHSPSATQQSSTNTSQSQHQPTPYQAPHPPNPQHPQPIHYAAAYSGHNRLYGLNNEIDGFQDYTNIPTRHLRICRWEQRETTGWELQWVNP